MSDILYVLIVTKPKEIKEQERCGTLDKGCVEFEKDGRQSSTERTTGDKSTNTNFDFNIN